MHDPYQSDPLRQPLTAAHFDQLTTASRAYHDLLAELDKAESCGIDCQRYRSEAQAAAAQATKLLATYFPNGRPKG
jgi:hypothetical protein